MPKTFTALGLLGVSRPSSKYRPTSHSIIVLNGFSNYQDIPTRNDWEILEIHYDHIATLQDDQILDY